MTDTAVYRLSTIDQSFIRTYHRICLCFPCSNEPESRQRVVDSLTASLRRTSNNMPILAGAVHPCLITSPISPGQAINDDQVATRRESESAMATLDYDKDHGRRESVVSDGSACQRGRLEVRVTGSDMRSLKPILQFVDEQGPSPSYDELVRDGMPAAAFMDSILTPLPDMPDPAEGSNPVFAIKANFINGGVLVAIYMHYSVADIIGVGTIIRHLSSQEEVAVDVEVSTLTLQQDASEQSRARDRLSGSRGVKANVVGHPEYHRITGAGIGRRLTLAPNSGACRTLSFDLKKLQDIRTMVLERFHLIHDKPQVEVSTKDCLAAILWKLLTRARWIGNDEGSGQPSSMLIPVDLREKVDPALDGAYYGNASLYAHSIAPIISLCLPFDVGTISRVAQLVHSNVLRMTETKVRSAIALINDREDVRSVNHLATDFDSDVFITDWSELPVGSEASLGLGLGPPQFVRKVSRQHSSYGCVLLPSKPDEGSWEVLVQLTDEAMERLLDDPTLKSLVWRVA